MFCQRLVFSTGAMIAALGGTEAAAENTVPEKAATHRTRDGSHDFDFLFGQWTVAHHKLRHRLANSNEWDDFSGTTIVRPLLGGRSNLDENVMSNGSGGVSLRLYDAAKQQWSIYWIGTNSYALEPPVVGRFVDGRGEFHGDDTFDGKPIRVRFIWSQISLNGAQWEQAFSTDAGKTWETNWTMRFTRVAF